MTPDHCPSFYFVHPYNFIASLSSLTNIWSADLAVRSSSTGGGNLFNCKRG